MAGKETLLVKIHENYSIDFLQQLKTGKYGTSYKGQCNSRNEVVVIKHLDYQNKQARYDRDFENECRKLITWSQQNQNENLVKYYEYVPLKDEDVGVKHYHIMEYCNQGNLSDYVLANPTLTLARKVGLMTQCVKALDYLHASDPPIVHRDIKPNNILIKREDNRDMVKLSDFYSSTLLHTGQSGSALSQFTISTDREVNNWSEHDYFKAPEYFIFRFSDARNGEPSAPCDVFSLGLVFYSLIQFDVEQDGVCDILQRPQVPGDYNCNI